MAEIEMERKPRNNTWIWVAALLLVVVLAVGAWFLFARGTTGYETSPGAERTPEVQEQPYGSPTAPGDAAPAPARPEEQPTP